MTRTVPETAKQTFEPRWPTWAALGIFVLSVGLLSLPMLTGQLLAGPWSDQYATGFAFRHWAADQWRALGHVPLWNPTIFGGMPFVAAMHGDIFYPTAWLRLLLPTALAMNLGFLVHYVLAGLFLYLFLRLVRVSWGGAVAGGLAYQLSGVVGSYVAPGHDGKLFVTALLPLALIALVLGIRRRRLEGHALLALTVGLGVLSPHPQMLYYLLVAAGVFALYLAFGERERPPLPEAVRGLALALAAVVVGVGIGMVQILPFYEYIPFSPRADTYYGYEGATSYAVPWSHIPGLVLSGFVGTSQAGTYWGANPIKLHSEYLGLTVVALAILGAAAPSRRRLVLWLGAIGVLFLLVALGGATPFYRVWWAVMPYMKKVRAPGMALYVVAAVVSVFAALGVERLQRGEGRRAGPIWLGVGGAVALLALVGGIGGMASVFAQGVSSAGGRALAAVETARPAIRVGALVSGLGLAALGGIVMAAGRVGRPTLLLALAVPGVVGLDLWLNARPFWTFSAAQEELYGGDPVIERLAAAPAPFRVLQVPGQEVYAGSSLMAFGIPQLLGYHGNEVHRFDQLMGGKNQWRNFASPRLWDLFAVRYLVFPSGMMADRRVPGYERVASTVVTGSRIPADVFEREDPVRWARLVPAAVKVEEGQAIAAVVDPQSSADPDRIVLLDPDAPLEPAPVRALPDPLDVTVTVEAWEPGAMRLRMAPAAPSDAYVLVGENWYPDWRARVDGVEAPVLRGNVSLMVVPVPRGAETVELAFVSQAYGRGKALSLVSLLMVLVGAVGPTVSRRMRRAS